MQYVEAVTYVKSFSPKLCQVHNIKKCAKSYKNNKTKNMLSCSSGNTANAVIKDTALMINYS